MDGTSLNHYEERLYSVFKTFDVNNEEALDKGAVLALCDALQLEQRGAALVDTLFERRDQRVTFAQFRSGLLNVLGDTAHPAAPPPADRAPSDEDSSGQEVAPKFVFGSKKYGRRSRPTRSRPASAAGLSPEPPPSPSPSPSPAPATEPESGGACVELEHSSLVDCERALQLCRRLRMDGIERATVERVFESVPAGETTVGEFFDRLNACLTTSIGSSGADEHSDEEALPAELVVEAWEGAGVGRARRLLAELGFEAAALAPPRLQLALQQEAAAFAEPPDARAVLLTAALALARLRRERAARRAADAAAERDRARADVDEANRRARLLAQEVDENHARLEAELAATLKRSEARHAEQLRRAEQERAADRERANVDRALLEQELARRQDAEHKLRCEADALRDRVSALEAKAAAEEERAAEGLRECARLAEEVRELREQEAGAAGAAEQAAREQAARADELRAENVRLRDRCDELAALLEARARPAPPPPRHHSWQEEAAVLAPSIVPIDEAALESESPPVSLETSAPLPLPVQLADHSGCEQEAARLRAQLADADARHTSEKEKLDDLVRELEASLEAMREEYEQCEEYWAGKLAEERALLAEEQRASDQRLAELVAKIGDYERQFAVETARRPDRLPSIPEAPALEAQAAQLDAAATELAARSSEVSRQEAEVRSRAGALARREADAARRARELQARELDLARLAASLEQLRRANGHGCGGCGGCGGEAELRARLARAEAGAATLARRLHRADLLVKDLYVENCLLGPPPRRL